MTLDLRVPALSIRPKWAVVREYLLTAVVNHNGTTIESTSANFGSVIQNLQKLHDGVAKNNRLIGEKSK